MQNNFFLAAPENETWKLFPRKQFSGNFLADFYKIPDFDMILVILTVFLGSRGVVEEKLFCKQTIHFRDLAKGEDENCFEKGFRETIIFRRKLMHADDWKSVYQNTL